MDNGEYEQITSLMDAIEQVYKMDAENFEDTLQSIVDFYMQIFAVNVIRTQRSGIVESGPLEWLSGKYSIYTSATMYSNAEDGIYSIGLRFMDEAQIIELNDYIQYYPDDCEYVFPEIILDLTEDGWEARIVLVDLSDQDKPSEVFALADNKGVQILHPSVANAENFLYRVQKHATNTFLLSAFSLN